MKRQCLLLALLLGSCAAGLGEPQGLFNAYRDAYADGNALRMWELTTPEAQKGIHRIRVGLLKGFRDPDPAARVIVEGHFGGTAADIEDLDDRALFAWLLSVIRKRLNATYVRNAVSAMRAVRTEYKAEGIWLIYSEADGGQAKMAMRRQGTEWRVDELPFPRKERLPD